jgi:Flp pilus assembly protein TadG
MKQRRWCRLWAATDGLGAIEFGFIAPVLLLMLLGVLDFGMAFWQQMEIAGATDAGAQWGMTNTYDSNSITSVVQAATSLSVPTANISPSNPCGCASSSGVTTYACTSTCPDGSAPKIYIFVSAHVCFKPIFTWPGLNFCSGSTGTCTGCNSSQISLSSQSVVLK